MSKRTIEKNQVMYGSSDVFYEESVPKLRKILRPFLNPRLIIATKSASEVKPRRLLDFGCGQGQLLSHIAVCSSDSVRECVGIDIVDKNIARASQYFELEKIGKSVPYRFIQGDERALSSFPDKYFDLITCIAVFELVDDLYGLANALKRLLTDNGYLIAEFANFAYLPRRLKLFFGGLPTTTPIPIEHWPKVGWDGSILHYFTKKAALEFLKQSGFMATNVRPTGLLSNLRILSTLLSTGFVITCQHREN